MKIVCDVNFLKRLYALKDVFNDITFVVNEEGIMSKMLDVTKTTFVRIEIDKNEFYEYDVEGERKITFELLKIKPKMIGKVATLDIGTDKMIVTMDTGDKKIRYSIPLLSEGDVLEKIPKIDYEEVVVVKVKDLIEGIDFVTENGTEVAFETTEEGLKVKGVGMRDIEFLIKSENKLKGGVRAMFNSMFMSKILKGMKDEMAVISLATDTPMKITIGEKGAVYEFYFAPLIED